MTDHDWRQSLAVISRNVDVTPVLATGARIHRGRFDAVVGTALRIDLRRFRLVVRLNPAGRACSSRIPAAIAAHGHRGRRVAGVMTSSEFRVEDC